MRWVYMAMADIGVGLLTVGMPFSKIMGAFFVVNTIITVIYEVKEVTK